MLDYFQQLAEEKGGRNQSNRARELADIAYSVKALTLKYDMTIFAASQFNREVDGRKGGVPLLSDFKESGGLEEACDMAILLWPELDDMGIESDIINASVAKNRHGKKTTFQMVFVRETGRIRSLQND